MSADERNSDLNGATPGVPAGNPAGNSLQRAILFYQQGNYAEALKLVTFHQARHGNDIESDLLLYKLRKRLEREAGATAAGADAPPRNAAEPSREQLLGKIRKHYGLGNYARAGQYVTLFESRYGPDPDVDAFRYKIERKLKQTETAEAPPAADEVDDLAAAEDMLVLDSLFAEGVPPPPAAADVAPRKADDLPDLLALSEADLQPAAPAATTAPPQETMEWPDQHLPVTTPAPPVPHSSAGAEPDMFSLGEADLQSALPEQPLQIEFDEQAFQMQLTPLLEDPPPLPPDNDAIALGGDDLADSAAPPAAPPPRETGHGGAILEWPEAGPAPQEPPQPHDGDAASRPSDFALGGTMLEWPEEEPRQKAEPTPEATMPTPHAATASRPGLDGLPLYYPPAQADGEFKVTAAPPDTGATLYQGASVEAAAPPAVAVTASYAALERPVRKRGLWLSLALAVVLLGAGAYYLLVPTGQPPAQVEPPVTTAPGVARETAPADPRLARFARLLDVARQEIAAGRLPAARQKLQQAKDIRVTADLLALEKLVQEKLAAQTATPAATAPEEAPAQPATTATDPLIVDGQTYQRALELQNAEGYREYLRLFPWGQHRLQAEKSLRDLENRARQEELRLLEQRAAQEQRVRLPTEFRDLDPAAAQSALNRAPGNGSRLETVTFDGEAVLADFSTGLMWHLWDSPMDFDRSGIWSIRRWARYANWRLPTVEEAASLAVVLRGDSRNLLPAAIEIWTGDRDSADSRNRWVVRLGDTTCRPVRRDEAMRVCAVRSMRR